MIINDFSVAPLRIEALSSISCIKVETPRNWQSPAPTRANMQSRIEMLALSHGTKQPTCAMRIFTPTCRINVDFPPILGPVIIWNQLCPLTSLQSFGIKFTQSCASTQGCLQPSKIISPSSEEVISGLVYGVGQLEAKSAKLSKTSNSESLPAKEVNTSEKVAAVRTTRLTSSC
uniref:DNA mismatch repair protein MSH2 n=1 Tax=Rhizophora mucronata TaxID=61149 RepID=A0A2P2J8C9_RHIMU